MKTVFFLVIFLVAELGFAQNKVNWITDGIYQQSTAHGNVTGINVQRQIMVGKTPVRTMTLSFSVHPMKPNEVKSELEIANHLAKIIGLGKWVVKKESDFVVFDKYWPEQNRYLRLLVRKEKNRVLMSLATVRSVFIYPSLVEAEVLQRNWFNQVSEIKTSLNEFWWSTFVSTAFAQLGFKPPKYTPRQLFDGANTLIGNIGRTGLENIGTNIGRIAEVANTQISGVTGAINNVADSGNNIANQIRKAEGTINKNFSAANIAKGVAGGIIVGTLASTAISVVGNFVLDGTIKAAKSLYYWIKQEVDPETAKKIDSLTKESLETLERSGKELVDLEKSIDEDLAAASLAYKKNPDFQLQELRSKENDTLELIQQMKMQLARSRPEEFKGCLEKIKELQSVLDILRKMKDEHPDVVCEKLRSNLNQFVQIQNTVHQAKMNVQNHMLMVIGGNLGKSVESLKPLTSVNRMLNACKDHVKEMASQNKESGDSAIHYEIKSYLDGITSDCKEIADLQNGTHQQEILRTTARMAQANTAVAKAIYKNLRASDCEEGSATSNGICSGKPGFLHSKAAEYNKQAQKYNQVCQAKSGSLAVNSLTPMRTEKDEEQAFTEPGVTPPNPFVAPMAFSEGPKPADGFLDKSKKWFVNLFKGNQLKAQNRPENDQYFN